MARLVILLLCLLPVSALADPITITVALIDIGLPSAAAAFIASYGGYLALGAFTLYRSAQARRKAKDAAAQARAQAIANLQDRTANVISSEAPGQVIYGEPGPVGGTVVAVLESGTNDEFKHVVIVFSCHKMTSMDKFYIEGVEVPLGVDGWVNAGEFLDTSQSSAALGLPVYATEAIVFDGSGVGHSVETPSGIASGAVVTSTVLGEDANGIPVTYTGGTSWSVSASYYSTTVNVTFLTAKITPRVHITAHLGDDPDTADAFLMEQCPDKWTAAHKLSGLGYAVVTLDLRHPKLQSAPQITMKGKGKPLYDYRTTLTAYSRNNALATADFLRSWYGFSATAAQLDVSSWSAAATACDVVAYATSDGGSVSGTARFTCDGVFTTDQDRTSVLQQLEDSFAANTHRSGGVWRCTPGTWTTPVKTLNPTDALAPLQVKQASFSVKDRYNVARGTFIDKDSLGSSKDYTAYKNATWIASDGAEFPLTLSFTFTGTNQRCVDLARIAVEKSRGGFIVDYPAKASAWPLQPGDRVWVNDSTLNLVNKTMRITDWVQSPRAPIGLQLIEDVASFYDLADSAVEDPAPNGPTRDPYAKPSAPEDFNVATGTSALRRYSDGTILSQSYLTWAQSTDPLVLQGGKVIVQVRKAVANAAWLETVELPGFATEHYFTNLEDGVAYIFRIRFRNGMFAYSEERAKYAVQLGKDELPTQPASVVVTADGVTVTPVADLDLDGYRIRSTPGILSSVSAADWSKGTDAHKGLITEFPWNFVQKLYGPQTIMVVAVDTSKNESAPQFGTYTFPAADSNNVAYSYDYKANSWPGTLVGTTSGGNIYAPVAASADFYSRGGTDFYSPSDYYGGDDFDALSWTSSVFNVPYGGGQIVIDSTLAGRNPKIEYSSDGSATGSFYDAASTDYYTNTSGDFYGGQGPWADWPGALLAPKYSGFFFRVTTEAGTPQGSASAFTVRLVMERVRQEFGVININAAGTRLAPSAGLPPRNWISVDTVVVTPTLDGSGAVSSGVLDYSAVYGPNVQLLNSAGSPVTGNATAHLGGIEDAGTN